MRPNAPPDKQRTVPDPNVGIRWGKMSQFRFSAQSPELGTTGEVPGAPLPFVRNSTKHKFETRIETIPAPNFTQFRKFNPIFEHIFFGADGSIEHSRGSQELNGEVYEYQVDLGEEAQQEIVGFTSYPDGSVVERFKTILVKRLLDVAITKRPSSPTPGGLGRAEGERE
jgi:hypothetical protein